MRFAAAAAEEEEEEEGKAAANNDLEATDPEPYAAIPTLMQPPTGRLAAYLGIATQPELSDADPDREHERMGEREDKTNTFRAICGRQLLREPQCGFARAIQLIRDKSLSLSGFYFSRSGVKLGRIAMHHQSCPRWAPLPGLPLSLSLSL